MNPYPVQIETERLTLRLGRPDDAEAMARFFVENKDHLHPFVPPRGKEQLEADYWRREFLLRDTLYREDRGAKLLLFLNEKPQQVAGACNFNDIIRGAFHACNLGYSLAADCEGRGLMTEALRAAIPFAFDELRLHRIQANYMPHNDRSARILEGLGFVKEGLARNYLYIHNAWQDHVLTSLTNPDWR